MKHLAIAVPVVTAVIGCSSSPTTPSTVVTSPRLTATTPAAGASSTPAAGETSASLRATTGTSTTATGTRSPETVGQGMGARITFYAIAKAAGLNDSARMDALAQGICSRIQSGKPATVGTWLKETFQLKGDVAAKVAIAAIEFQCPQFKSLVGS